MIWFIILAFLVLIGLAIWLGQQWDYHRNWLGIFYIPWLIVVWLLILFTYNRALDYQSSKCAKWSIETGYRTKYVNIGYDAWSCYGLVNSNWIPIENIRGIKND